LSSEKGKAILGKIEYPPTEKVAIPPVSLMLIFIKITHYASTSPPLSLSSGFGHWMTLVPLDVAVFENSRIDDHISRTAPALRAPNPRDPIAARTI
jgi:hypothetical protein